MSFIDYFNIKKFIPGRTPNPTVRQSNVSDYQKFLSQYGFALRTNSTTSDREALQLALTNPYVTACIEAISEAIVGNGYRIQSADGTVGLTDSDQVYLEQVFNNPEGLFASETFNSLFLKISKSLSIYGEAFVELLTQPDTGALSGFRFIPSDLLDYDEDKNRWYYRNQPSLYYDEGELIHIKNPSITYENRYRGESPINKIALAIKSMTAALTHNYDTFSNPGLNVNHVLEFDKDVSNENFEQQLELIGEMARAHQSGGLIALKGARFTSLDSTSDLDYKELMNTCRDIILTVYRVPPAKVGVIESGNIGGGTGVSQDKTFKDMINAKSRLIEDSFNKVLIRYGYNYRFKFNEIDLEDKKNRADTDAVLINSGVKTINEVRETYDLEPISNGDTPLPLLTYDLGLADEEAELNKRLLNNFYTTDILNWEAYEN